MYSEEQIYSSSFTS